MRRTSSAMWIQALFLALVGMVLVASPLSAQAEATASDQTEAVASSTKDTAHASSDGAHKHLTCEEILAAKDSGHGGHEGTPDTAQVILHHVGNDGSLAFESPFPTSEGTPSNEAILNFKELQCRLTGWNGVVTIGSVDVDLTPTKHTFWLWMAGLILVLTFALVRPPKKGEWVPKGLYSVLEMGVLFVRDDIARANIKDREAADRYTPYLLSAFFFILVMNTIGLIPWCASATGNISVTLALALFTFIMTQVATIRSAGVTGFLKHLTGGVHWLLWPIMVPVEILGLFTKPFALMVRLFANMVAGHIVIYFLLGLIFLLGSWLTVGVAVPFALAIYLLEILVAFLQAYIFTLLSSIFIGLGVEAGHHGHEEKGESKPVEPVLLPTKGGDFAHVNISSASWEKGK